MNNLNLAVQNYFKLKSEINGVKILLVTKGVEADFLIDFIKKTNHFFFAENYATELKKWKLIKEIFPNIEVNFIGSFQSGNIRNIVKICETVESVSSFKQFEKLQKEAQKQSKNMKFYAQINIGNESQKNGFLETEITEEFTNFFTGLMCIPPVNQNPEYYFKKMKNIGEKLSIENLSMGMSSDFQKAIKYGATEVRIGTIIFGDRKK